MDDNVYIPLDATSSILPRLKLSLPYASTELYVVDVSPVPNSTVLATFPPTESLKRLDLGYLESQACWRQFFFWSLVSAASAINEDEDEKKNTFVRRTPSSNRCLNSSIFAEKRQ